MANYDRQLLIPYLRDVCSVEMLCRKLQQDIQSCQTEADKYIRWANAEYKDPPMPDPSDYPSQGSAGMGGLVVGGSIMLLGFLLLDALAVGLTVIAVGFIIMIMLFFEQSENDKIASQCYEAALSEYNKIKEQNKQNRANGIKWRNKAMQLKSIEKIISKHLADAQILRSSLYDVNIIPSRYRTAHAAYYLYDYFESCRETDLDKIIQTMLLDEIVKRMDKLLAQNQEILLNQRRQIAIQEQQNRAIADHHREEMQHIARMERNQERQMDYQYMIECNQKVTNFFLAADYIEKHR